MRAKRSLSSLTTSTLVLTPPPAPGAARRRLWCPLWRRARPRRPAAAVAQVQNARAELLEVQSGPAPQGVGAAGMKKGSAPVPLLVITSVYESAPAAWNPRWPDVNLVPAGSGQDVLVPMHPGRRNRPPTSGNGAPGPGQVDQNIVGQRRRCPGIGSDVGELLRCG